jgi:hypothetical protein
VYARHVEDPDLSGGVNLSALSLSRASRSNDSRPKGLWGVSPLYVNPVNGLITLAKVLAEGKAEIPSLPRGRSRERPSEACLPQAGKPERKAMSPAQIGGIV